MSASPPTKSTRRAESGRFHTCFPDADDIRMDAVCGVLRFLLLAKPKLLRASRCSAHGPRCAPVLHTAQLSRPDLFLFISFSCSLSWSSFPSALHPFLVPGHPPGQRSLVYVVVLSYFSRKTLGKCWRSFLAVLDLVYMLTTCWCRTRCLAYAYIVLLPSHAAHSAGAELAVLLHRKTGSGSLVPSRAGHACLAALSRSGGPAQNRAGAPQACSPPPCLGLLTLVCSPIFHDRRRLSLNFSISQCLNCRALLAFSPRRHHRPPSLIASSRPAPQAPTPVHTPQRPSFPSLCNSHAAIAPARLAGCCEPAATHANACSTGPDARTQKRTNARPLSAAPHPRTGFTASPFSLCVRLPCLSLYLHSRSLSSTRPFRFASLPPDPVTTNRRIFTLPPTLPPPLLAFSFEPHLPTRFSPPPCPTPPPLF